MTVSDGACWRWVAKHFRKGTGGACVNPPGYRWSKDPLYVITVAAPPDKRFVATCLEEFLSERFQPLDNTMGKTAEVALAD
jgi:hypothetical protein